MEKVLLAVEGVTPSKKALRYAVELCKRIKAELDVLQVISSRNYKKYIKNLGERVNRARSHVESSMIAATFAEAGEHEIAKALKEEALTNIISEFLPDSERDTVHCHLSVRSGPSDEEIVHFVNDHRDIVLTIYDAPEEDRGDTSSERNARVVPRRIRHQLSTPLVVLKG
jgi:nucleotide-binding universal stress UspA family protein